ncbi:MAG: dTDP-4-dehydrorhamnose reductase [Pyrinomonadaceae bacterium]
MKILITGAGGFVAGATINYCESINDEVVALTRVELDIANREAVLAILAKENPDSVINCAAWTDVDGCESDRDKNYAANAFGVENLALGCRQVRANFVTISTDYVFDGAKEGFYTQRDDPNPLSEYGKAKLKGEQLARMSLARAIVVRTGWIFGANGRNFLSKVPQLVLAGKTVKAINDAYGTPTFAPDLAKRLRELAELDVPGIYHVTNSGNGTTYGDFARKVVDIAAPSVDQNLIENVSFTDLKRPAPRPQNSKLRCLISERFGLEPLPDWKTALSSYIAQITAA